MISWVAIDTDIGDNPKLWELADALGHSTGNSTGIPLESCVGFVTMLLGKVAVHAHDGQIADISDRLIEEWAKWRGTPGAFAHSFRRLFASDGTITGWEKRQGKLIEHIEKVKERDRRRKSSRKPTGIPVGTVPDLTVHTTTTTTGRSKKPDKPTSADAEVEAIIAHYLTLHPQRRPGSRDRGFVRGRLKTHTADEIRAAIEGNATDVWHKERGKHELEYILRDSKIDDFRLRPAMPDPTKDAMTDEHGRYTPAYYKLEEAGYFK